MIAAVVPVPDEATKGLMLALDEELTQRHAARAGAGERARAITRDDRRSRGARRVRLFRRGLTTLRTVKTKPLRSTVELILTVAVALFFALTIQAFAVKPYRIPSGSMLPTLEPGQRILVNRFSHHIGGDPKLGDVTVFTPPRRRRHGTCGHAGEGPNYDGRRGDAPLVLEADRTHSDTTFVKRVVGMPGDTIAVVNGHVIRNGKRTSEPFACGCAGPECNLNPITDPARARTS